jgi:uncharacterized protein (TIGR03435 family)
MTRTVTIAILVTLLVSVHTAQQPKPRFEVASIKKRDSPAPGFARLLMERGTFSVPATSLAYLVEFAYQVRDDQIVDGPGWIRTDPFEVHAKAPYEASADEMRPMMQSLLAERFGLVVGREQRVMPHFDLLPARADGRLGPNLRQTDDCRNPETRPPRPPQPSGAASQVGCGAMASIATITTRWIGRPVVDRTGLKGSFHYAMILSPDGMPNIPGLPRLDVAASDPALPTFRDALRDQLGLKLDAVRGPLDVLSIKAVQQPTEN